MQRFSRQHYRPGCLASSGIWVEYVLEAEVQCNVIEHQSACCAGFRGPSKPVAKVKEKEKEKEKEQVNSESSHEMAPQARTERAKW